MLIPSRSMGVHTSVVTLISSTVGVAALAMPYCFQQCGILLSIMLIVLCAFICSSACDILITLCLTHRSLSLEKACKFSPSWSSRQACRRIKVGLNIIFHLACSVIGLMVGCVIGYDVSLSDLGTRIFSELTDTVGPHHFRVVVLSLFTVVITPLCMISKVQRLANMSAFALFFYSLMVIHALRYVRIVHLDWHFSQQSLLNMLTYWNLDSPHIDVQLHTVYAGMQYPSVSAIRYVVRVVVIVIAVAYGLFGFFGYVAFVDSGDLPGNVFLMYPNNVFTFVVQAGFLFTITVSIPLVLFPLRQSLHSFLFHRVRLTVSILFSFTQSDKESPSLTIDGETGEDGSVPTKRFRLMTVGILITCFLLSLTTNKIEVIIQLTSSLAGSLIGYILPGLAAFYAFAHHHFHKSSVERRKGTGLLCVGLFLLVSGLLAVHHQNSPPISMPSGGRDPHSPVENLEQISKHMSNQDLQNDIHRILSIDKKNGQARAPDQLDRRHEDSLVDKSSIVSREKLVDGEIDISHNAVQQRRPNPIQPAELVEPVSVLASVYNVTQTPNSFASLTPAPLKADHNSSADRLIESPQRGAFVSDNRTDNGISPSPSFKHEKREPNISIDTSASNIDSKHVVSLEKAPITERFSIPDKVVGEVEARSENTRIQQFGSQPKLDDTNKIEVNERQVSGNDEIRPKNVIVKLPDPEALRNQTHAENAERIFVSSSPDGHTARYPSNGSNMLTLNLTNKEDLVESIPVLPIVEPKNHSILITPQAMIPPSVESLLRTESGSSGQTDGVTSSNLENLSNRSGLMNGTDETVPHPKSIVISGDNRISSDIEDPLEILPPAAHSHKVVSNESEVAPYDSGNSAPLDSAIDVKLSGDISVLSPVKHTIPDVLPLTNVSTVELVHLDEGKPSGKSDVVTSKEPESLAHRPMEIHSNEVVIPHKSVLMPVEPEELLSVDSKRISNLKPPVPSSQNSKASTNKYPGDPLSQVHIETR
ncbi:hypothetical protein EG68_03976 [Paragonimus skrjabini miyazakii]|uniref:Amino acid transporter transmembrane domain-containing protein n=1 Tax=Paragonimus skrjabini miyazakii TaxID=59628 RepID=A0A8S9Z6X4_9TREM|nr:hypothetical protein EG68_03976 [Paragonimus skrjabini miyazakii]